MDRLGSVGVKNSFSYTHFESEIDGRVPAASRLFDCFHLLHDDDDDDE